MPRANRYFIPGYVWHITHRCHKKKFLLGFGRDRQVWIKWLFEARKRYDLEILNYTVTSNHVHLLVYNGPDRETILRSIQLVAGRTAQEYGCRYNVTFSCRTSSAKNTRKFYFWTPLIFGGITTHGDKKC